MHVGFRDHTGPDEAGGGGGGGPGVDDDELERIIRHGGSEEVVDGPLERVDAVVALVDSDHHHLLLGRRHESCTHPTITLATGRAQKQTECSDLLLWSQEGERLKVE